MPSATPILVSSPISRLRCAASVRARAVSVAYLRKLLNYNLLQEAESDLEAWLEKQRPA